MLPRPFKKQFERDTGRSAFPDKSIERKIEKANMQLADGKNTGYPKLLSFCIEPAESPGFKTKIFNRKI